MVLAIGILFIAFMLGNAALNYGGCHWYGYQTDRTVRFAMGVGCLVQMDSGWTPKAELRTEQ